MNVFYASFFKLFFPLFESQLMGVNLLRRMGGNLSGISNWVL